MKRRNARRNKNIHVLNTEFKRTAKISNLEVAQVCVCLTPLAYTIFVFFYNNKFVFVF